MATLKDIKLRIGSIKNTQHITKAMKMVSASKMKRAEEHIKKARPYADKLKDIVTNLSQGMEEDSHPLLKKRTGGKAVFLLITSDKGLCGGLNSILCKTLALQIQEGNAGFDSYEIIPVGKKGFEFFKARGYELGDVLKDMKQDQLIEEVTSRVAGLNELYIKGEINSLYLIFNHFKNVITQIPTIQKILPIEPPEAVVPDESSIDYIFEPEKDQILNRILPHYVENLAFTALLDNVASEHASRMTAMDAATKNAGEMLSALQLQYNRARQAAITTELIEIISGAESL